MDAIAPTHHALGLWSALISRVRELMAGHGAHAARTVVLVPYAQLMPLARRLWAQQVPDGFAPRIETTMNWAARLGFAPDEDDLAYDMPRDLLTARTWLDRAGLGRHAGVLAGRLVEAAWQLGAVVAAVPPPQRGAWAAQARASASLGLDAGVLALEAAVARIAVEWAAASAHAADALWRPEVAAEVDLLVVLQGLEPDPLAQALAASMGERALVLPLDAPAAPGAIVLHPSVDPADEAERAAACVVRHVAAGRVPVALAAVDRVLTRRIRAMLETCGLAIRDETGWKLSTTRAAARVMAALRGCAWDASSDEVLDWLKHAPAAPPATVSALERRVRRAGLRDWGGVHAARMAGEAGGWSALIEQANAWRQAMQAPRRLAAWQQSLRELLQATRQWDGLAADAAGVQVLEMLGLPEAAQARWAGLPQAARRMSLADFTTWVSDALEAASFVPEAPAAEQVVILPFNQLLARPFPALVLPGCDEQRLAPSPDPAGPWTAAQRTALGLPTREALAQAVRAGWQNALRTPQCDVLWRCTDDGGEPVLASPLVMQLRADGLAAAGNDPREARPLAPEPVRRPLPRAQQLPVEQLSASGYDDLRHCPYRFFALRQLGLQEAAEIDAELDKRDFGNWLHRVLRDFHVALQAGADAAARAALLDAAAAEATRALGLADGEFLPFSAAWPQVRDGYLDWLARHEADTGARFEAAERALEMPLGALRLVGRIDRIDRLPDGRVLVIDYKTESRSATLERVRGGGIEDTQLAFYAALLDDDSLRAAYVNIGERGKTETLEAASVVEARDALVAGVIEDIQRIAAGAALPALGEGRACEWCGARGLCRRDFWSE